MNAARPQALSRARGFSLVEVALAVAVIGVSLLAVVGLLPPLMETERESGFRSMLPKLKAQALSELRATKYPDSLPHTREMLFTESGELTTEAAQAIYKCTATLTVPSPSTGGATGGVPEIEQDFCLVSLACSLTSQPASTPVIFHDSLAKEK